MAVPLKLTIVGAQGRMGQTLIAVAQIDPTLEVVSIVVRAGNPVAGDIDPIAGIAYGTDLAATLAHCDVVIEFAGAGAVAATATACAAAGVPLVAGSTGLDAEAEAALARAAARIPVLTAANFAPGVVVLNHLVALAAQALPSFIVEIDETHHLQKKDSPSGTALSLHDAVRAGRGPDTKVVVRSHREGEVVGDHSVAFSSPGERLTLSHHAAHRELFARGALLAAAWLAGRPAGRYTMEDVLGLAGKPLAR